MSAIAGSVSLSAAKARGLGFKQSAPMGSRVAAAVPAQPRARTERGALKVVAGNDYEGGLFAPIVVVARDIIGVKRFNQIRGKAIALHSQVSARTGVDATFRTRITSELSRFRSPLALGHAEARARHAHSSAPASPASGEPILKNLADSYRPRIAGHHRLLQGDRRRRQGSPEPHPHRQAERRQARLPRVN